jgi:hypothetical protein
MDGAELVTSTAEKDLGIVMDNKLNFDNHINETAKKANRIAGMILGNIQYKHKSILVPLFKSLVRPILEYGNTVWNTTLKKHTEAIENIQRRYTRRIQGANHMGYEDRLSFLKLPSLEYRRLRGDMIETFKLMHNFYDADTITGLFHLPVSTTSQTTRGHKFKILKQATNTSKYANFFTNRVTNIWNKLPETVVTAESVNSFKNKLDMLWKNHMYKINIELH